MNIIIAVHDLTLEKWHLMPWRTVVEVTYGLQSLGHNVILVSLENADVDIRNIDSDLLPPGSCCISKKKSRLANQLVDLISLHQADILFWPVTWREPRWRSRVVAKQQVRTVGWFPGGVYARTDTLYALYKIGLKKTLPYLLDAFYPKVVQMRFMRRQGLDALIAMTPLTSLAAINNGWPPEDIYVIPPAKEIFNEQVKSLSDDVTRWLNGHRFLLFMGPPSAIRGVNELLDAFERAAFKSDSMRLICLFRGDGRLDRDSITLRIEAMLCRKRIYVIWESLPKALLNGFIRDCHAVVMPFVLVPSEIPLAIIETTAFSKPVLSTRCGGTGEFVAEFGITSPVGDVAALSESMLKMFHDQSYYESCCRASNEVYARHPQWPDVAAEWCQIAEKITAKAK